jgi:hypothetical protein
LGAALWSFCSVLGFKKQGIITMRPGRLRVFEYLCSGISFTSFTSAADPAAELARQEAAKNADRRTLWSVGGLNAAGVTKYVATKPPKRDRSGLWYALKVSGRRVLLISPVLAF